MTFGQLDSSYKIRYSIDAGIIVNRAFSSRTFKEDNTKFSSEKYSAAGDANQFLPGAYIGANFKYKYFYFGINVSYSQARYHYYSYTSLPNGVSVKSYVENSDASLEFYNLNFEGGFKSRVAKNFYLMNTLLVHNGLYSFEKKKGTLDFAEWNTATGYYNKNQSEINASKKGNRGLNGFSYRLGLTYNFKHFGITAFRNFGYPARPWWGLGATIPLN